MSMFIAGFLVFFLGLAGLSVAALALCAFSRDDEPKLRTPNRRVDVESHRMKNQ